MFNQAILCIVLLTASAGGQRNNWGYIAPTGPRQWSTIDPSYIICSDGTRQSPINICTTSAQLQQGLSFQISNAGFVLNGSLANLEEIVEYIIVTPEPYRPNFTVSYNGASGYTDGRYVLQQFHFHWGSVNGQGSEHLFDSQATVAEVHFVARNIIYNSSVAGSMSDGFLVLGVRIVVCANGSSQFDPLFGANNEYLNQVRYYPQSVDNIFLNLYSIYNCNGECATTRRYYIYQGSLTTPACNEAVTWWVASDTLCISQSQLDMLRTQKVNVTGPVLTDNFRPDQSLNQRVVITNLQSMGTIYAVNTSLFCFLMLLALLFV